MEVSDSQVFKECMFWKRWVIAKRFAKGGTKDKRPRAFDAEGG